MDEKITLAETPENQNPEIQSEVIQEPLTEEEPAATEIPSEEKPSEETAEEISSEEKPSEETVEEIPSEAKPPEATENASDPISEIMKKPPYHERYYLQYNEGKRTAKMDLEGTKSFLQGIGFDGGELLQARRGAGQSEAFRNVDKNSQTQMYCSYCGAEISGVEYYRLPDGRLRCTSCSRSIVTDKEEIREICKRIIANMDNFFGATIDVPVDIEVLDERKLKKKIGVPLGTKDSQSMLILGVAINKKGKYTILLENGAPRISLIATFAHELTHIWQYTHWDNNKKLKQCPKSNRLLIYEGMAKWAEIQYLYLVGETTVAKREEAITRKREDEYGVGFCLYEDYFPLSRETMVCEETPFTPNNYPFSEKSEQE